MGGVLFDTSVYIDAFRSGDDGIVRARRSGEHGPIWLSSVVLAELYAGAGESAIREVQKLEYDFEAVGRLLVPNLTDWASSGRALLFLAKEFGYESIGRGRMMDDALIAMCASRTGTTVLTYNQRDFGRLSKFRTFSWQMTKR